MSDALFTYGTLQFPEVMEAVTGLALPWVEAEAPGFAQFCFTDRIYPGMVARKGALTQGRVYTALSQQTWDLLDRFEDPIYRRDLLEVYRGSRELVPVWQIDLAVTEANLRSYEHLLTTPAQDAPLQFSAAALTITPASAGSQLDVAALAELRVGDVVILNQRITEPLTASVAGCPTWSRRASGWGRSRPRHPRQPGSRPACR